MSRRVVDTGLGRVSWDQIGSGPDLVILHSLLTDRHAFDPVLPALSQGRRVDLVDLPGFGDSTPVDSSMDAYADAVGAFLEAAGFDPSTTTLLGNGLGAFISLGTAIRHGERFHRLCLVGCGVAFPEEARATFATMAGRVEEGGMGSVVDVAVRRIFPDGHLAAHPELFDLRREVLVRTKPDAFVTACRALQRVDYRADAGAVSNPTLLVVGSDDGATPPPMAQEAHKLIPGSTLIELEGVGHAPQLQDPAGFLEAVEGFLSAHP